MISTDIQQLDKREGTEKLREGWQIVRFGDVVRNVQVNIDPEESGLERYVAGEHMETDNLHIRQWGTIGDGYLGPAFHRKFVKGQVLYGSRRTYLRKVAVAEFDGICANTTFTLEPNENELLQDLLPFIMQTETFTEYSIKQSRGSVNPYINWKDIASYEFALPSKDEQRRIADILWAAEKEKEALSYASESLQKFYSTVGMEAFKRKPTKRILLGELVANGVLEFQTGPFGTVLKASSYVAEGTPIINPVNIVNGKLVTSDGPFLSYEECKRLSRYKMHQGDIILGRKGEMGRIIYVTKEYEGFIAGSDCIRIRLNTEELQSKFLYYLLISPQARKWLTRQASGTTMPGVNEKILAGFEVPIPDIRTQHEIVGLFQSIDEGVKTLQAKLEKHSTLSKFLLNRLLSHELI